MEFNQLKNIIEAALLAESTPISVARLATLFNEDENVGKDDVARALEALQADCEGRGIELVEVASGYRYQVRQATHAWVAKMWTERPSRYSRALLETLALIAYRQPITRGEIEAVRGVSVASSIIKTLEEREWIRVVGHRDVPGRPALFGTTREFLDYFKLKSLDELPSLAEIRDMEAFDPELNLDGDALPAQASVPDQDADVRQETASNSADADSPATGDTDLDETSTVADTSTREAPAEAIDPAGTSDDGNGETGHETNPASVGETPAETADENSPADAETEEKRA